MPRKQTLRSSASIASQAVDHAADEVAKAAQHITLLVDEIRDRGIELGIRQAATDGSLLERYRITLKIGY